MRTLAFTALLAAGFGVQAAELPVKEGLVLHLDAVSQRAHRKAAELPPLASGLPVDRWLDSSGGPLVALQPFSAGRPSFRMDDAEAFVRFDGKDDFLDINGARRRANEVTVFILAAPRGNPGGFSGMFGAGVFGQNDYTTGINLDQGPNATDKLSVLNVESAGGSGYSNYLQPGRNLAAGLPFDNFHVFTVRSSVGPKGNQLFLDGIALGDRPRAASVIGLDEVVIGGRLYSNDPGDPVHPQGSFNGDIAAVLVYDRALTDAEREKVEQALFARTPALNALASGTGGHALETVRDAPLVQMLVPGFEVEELPLAMRNLTGIRYRHDGKLVALGYDGRIFLVTDSDGDGREDQFTVFWDKSSLRGPIGMALLPKEDPRGDGVFVASKGKVSLILDRNRDGIADEEIIVAQGWKEIAQSVDAIGLAVDPKDGSIYFGLGTENYANGYLINAATGKSGYAITTEHGTIQKVSKDFSKRETVCTGTRFTCALAFNRNGDLFATEQEGATWLPNGNPFDELLHIQPGLHYGFPPRHPKHLPQVFDEPPVFDYKPQHQSTVGMVFNEGVNGGPTFGPSTWAGDALVCGESRGKLYRTRLVKTPQGYVAQNNLIACLSMLTIDTCVTPKGDLLVACHSGPPDWGTGPAGDGKIFRIRYTGRDTPQPVLAWAAAADEFRIAFDKPLRDADWAGARARTRIEAGRYVSAADRFEVIRPGYQVVLDQMATPRRWVDVQSLSLSADRRTIVLRVPRQTEAVNDAVTLPTPASWQTRGPIHQKPELDLALSLNGIQVMIYANGMTSNIVLPHPSPTVARALTAGSADHDAFLQRLEETKACVLLSLRGGIDIANVFVPATQPGATLDWDIDADAFANRSMTVQQDLSSPVPRNVALKAEGKSTVAPLQLELTAMPLLDQGGLYFALDDRVRPIALNRLLASWVTTPTEKPGPAEPVARTDVKGNWLHGRRVFFGDAGCGTCHTVRGEGIAFGPDLSNLIFRDRESVLQDILNPSATINPDHTGTTVKFKDGAEVNGIPTTINDEKIVLRLPANGELVRPRRDVVSIEPMKNSLMTETFGQSMTAEQREDLLTFLLTNPLEPAPITRLDPPMPPARTRDDVAAFVSASAPAPANQPPLRILLCIDDQDHGLDEHDYPLWQKRWSRLLALADNVTVETARGFPSRELLAASDVTVFYSRNSGWGQQAAALMDEYQQRGGGLVYLHWGMEGGKEAPALAERIGLATGRSKFRHGDMELNFTKSGHPITKGFDTLKFTDETYWAFFGDPKRITPLATAVEEGESRIQLWVFERGKARVFGSIPGHYTWTFDDPLYRVIVLRGIAWVSHQEDINRLVDLALVGARIAP